MEEDVTTGFLISVFFCEKLVKNTANILSSILLYLSNQTLPAVGQILMKMNLL